MALPLDTRARRARNWLLGLCLAAAVFASAAFHAARFAFARATLFFGDPFGFAGRPFPVSPGRAAVLDGAGRGLLSLFFRFHDPPLRADFARLFPRGSSFTLAWWDPPAASVPAHPLGFVAHVAIDCLSEPPITVSHCVPGGRVRGQGGLCVHRARATLQAFDPGRFLREARRCASGGDLPI